MNRLSIQERAHILRLLCDGMSIRSITALTGVSKNTVAKLLIDAGNTCANYHDANVRGVRTARINVAETWSFAHAKHKTGTAAKAAPYGANDAWLWVASEAGSKMIVSYRIGGRDAESAGSLMDDLETRLAHPFYLKGDENCMWLEPVEEVPCYEFSYGQPVRIYEGAALTTGDKRTTECMRFQGEGTPLLKDVLASLVESRNLTLRTSTRVVEQVADNFRKKVQNHASAVAFHIVCHNFVGICEASSATPAMIAGISDRPLEFNEIAMLVEQATGTPNKRGSYKKH